MTSDSTRRRHRRPLPLVALVAIATAANAEEAPPAPPADQRALAERLAALEARVHELEQQPTATTPGAAAAPGGLSFGAYGEMKLGAVQNPDADGAWQRGFDAARLTLQPSYRVNDAIVFAAEIEVEHGGIARDADDKLGGAIEVEQAWLDLAFDEHLHWRPPGVDLVPVGYTNLFHEPTLFYSVERPELASALVPTTWFEGATSIHGLVAGPVSYELQVSTTLVDEGSDVGDLTAARTPPAGGYAAGIDGAEGLRLARSTIGDYAQVSDGVACALRLAYDLPVRGLAGSSSVYWSPDVEPRGAYATDAGGATIGSLGRCGIALVDSELRWRPADAGIEARVEGVISRFSDPANLRANNDGDDADNVGRAMWGASAEIAWHWRPRGRWDVVPFYRLTREVLQTGGVRGADADAGLDAPTGAGRRTYHTVGVALFPAPQVALKLDYRAVVDASRAGARSDHVLGGVGFSF